VQTGWPLLVGLFGFGVAACIALGAHG